jgi:hypothetical protein
VASGLRLRGAPRATITEQVNVWLRRLGIEHLATRPARNLSGGRPGARVLRGRWSWSRTCCSSTSRSPPSITSRAASYGLTSRSSSRRQERPLWP